MIASSGVKNHVQRLCSGDHERQPLEGGRRTRLAQYRPEQLCKALIDGLLEDLHDRTVMTDFHDASIEESEHDDGGLGTLDFVYDDDDD
jgi:hypothetical protein